MRAFWSAVGAGMVVAGAVFGAQAGPRSASPAPPPVEREFRGVWVATVDNIDWPSKRGLSADRQKAEAIALLDRAAAMRLNAVVFQVRPACDALYSSALEPWSEYLTGEMGRAPEPTYDPLAFWVTEAHRRGLELHAWFNPYRARHPSGSGPASADHVSRRRPELVRTYGRHLWLDPGLPGVQDHTTAVVMDVVRRYDVDGIHLDDYFYPYKENGPDGKPVDFPDEPSWQEYVRAGGGLSRDDWRRENVNTLVRRLYREIKAERPTVKFGISPFGIWRPGYPASIQGFDAYQELYADARRWLVNGWVDYFTPQLYWKIDAPAQSYPVLLEWWSQQNPGRRHLWPGLYSSRVGDGTARAWPAEEVLNQVQVTRQHPRASGHVHFSARVFTQNRERLADRLAAEVYPRPALPPAAPWLDPTAPAAPSVKRRGGTLELAPGGRERPRFWVVQLLREGSWSTRILAGEEGSLGIPEPRIEHAAVSAVDAAGNQGSPTVVRLH